jgi:hypothetical protein
MKWMEWIKLQTANMSETTTHHLAGLSQAIMGAPGLAAVQVYEHASVTGDVAFLLLWETEQPQPQGSLVGIQLAGELRKVGLVAHTVWIQNPNMEGAPS